MLFIRYIRSTGEILSVGSGATEENCYIQMEDLNNEEILLDATADDSLHYIVEGEVVDRPVFDISDTINLPVGSSQSFPLPAGTRITFNGETEVLGVPQLELEGQFAATYTLQLELFPHQPKTVKVEVA